MNRSELITGNYYRCNLSNLVVMIVSVEEAITPENKKTLVVSAKYFNPVTGVYDRTTINDGQLELWQK